MKDPKLFAAFAILLIALILVLINEFTNWTFISDFAYLFIIGAMLLGMWLGKRIQKG